MDVIGKILRCVAEISEKHYFGEGVLLNVLRGSSEPIVLKYKLECTSLYGKLALIKREDLEIIVDWLVSNEFLLQREGKYPVLHLTYNGIHFPETIDNAKIRGLARAIKEGSPDAVFLTKEYTEKVMRFIQLRLERVGQLMKINSFLKNINLV